MKPSQRPLTIQDFQRYSNMEKLVRDVAERGYQSSRSAGFVVQTAMEKVKCADLASGNDVRSYWYNSKGKVIRTVINAIHQNPMTVDEILETVEGTNRFSLRRSLEYARKYGFVRLLGHGRFEATGKHLTLSQ